ncbi:universal stress protein [Cecembia rubra]|uniref:Nucleotide-binding universal stress UspA family protein n=2 Tax=Cecembia rubra TaxID=1485585 RepID=A0A2P8ECU0_9BACT|nr:universal stress protein [Cecembia rubra]PSL07283.1 nucleotide-binding universal stress UspA family protein [Cecembia rubra]
MKILVPIDFSENANNALDLAYKIAKLKKASITLLYAIYAVYDFAAQSTEILGQIEEDAKNELKKATESGKKEGLNVDYKLLQGTVASVTTSLAHREDYNLVVMGTQGASGIKKALVGSNTGHVIKECKVPILAVPEMASWEKIKKISVGLELQNEDEKYFRKLFELTEGLNLPYEFFHVKVEDNFEKNMEIKGLEAFLKEEHPNLKMNFKTIPAKEVGVGLQSYLNENEDAMLVMFCKDKTFFEYLFNRSESLEMAYHTHVPLLVIK